jgi:hypothetical protein
LSQNGIRRSLLPPLRLTVFDTNCNELQTASHTCLNISNPPARQGIGNTNTCFIAAARSRPSRWNPAPERGILLPNLTSPFRDKLPPPRLRLHSACVACGQATALGGGLTIVRPPDYCPHRYSRQLSCKTSVAWRDAGHARVRHVPRTWVTTRRKTPPNHRSKPTQRSP